MSGGGGHAAGGFDEPRLVLLSMGPPLEMDSDMRHDDDDSWIRATRLAAGVGT